MFEPLPRAGKDSTDSVPEVSRTLRRAISDLRNIPRAKSDEVIRAIAATGGVIGVAAVPEFLAAGNGLTIEAMLDHIDYIARLVGWQHVAIGTDWPLQLDKQTLQGAYQSMAREYTGSRTALEPPRQQGESAPTPNLVGFDDYRDFPNVTGVGQARVCRQRDSRHPRRELPAGL